MRLALYHTTQRLHVGADAVPLNDLSYPPAQQNLHIENPDYWLNYDLTIVFYDNQLPKAVSHNIRSNFVVGLTAQNLDSDRA